MAETRNQMAAAFVRGPRFYEGEGGTVMFVHQLDSRSSIGPREATDEDIAKHPDAYARMGELPETPLGARVVVAAEFPDDGKTDINGDTVSGPAKPFAERRKRAEA